MKYYLKSQIFYDEKNNRRAYIQSTPTYLKSYIRDSDGNEMLTAELRMNSSHDARRHEYLLTDSNLKTVASARPYYAESDTPEIYGWPFCRTPEIDNLSLKVNENSYEIVRIGYPKYEIRDSLGNLVLGLSYSLIARQWNVYADNHFTEAIICGIILFCQYLEFENDVIIL